MYKKIVKCLIVCKKSINFAEKLSQRSIEDSQRKGGDKRF